MKKIITLMLLCVFLPSFSNAYIDLENNHFAYTDIIELKDKDIAWGYPDGNFRPDKYITEEELITILLRSANLDVCQNFDNWPNDYIELALNNGIIIDESLVSGRDFIDFLEKISILPVITDGQNSFSNRLQDKINDLSNFSKTIEYVTRAEACIVINNLLKDEEISTKDLPHESEIYFLSDENIDINTIINSVEIFEYDSYSGNYKEIIDSLKNGQHPYLMARNKRAQGNYVIAINFNTQNNSKYGAWASYNSLKLEGLEVIDAFDMDEIKNQLMNLAYNSNLVKPLEEYSVTAFYIVRDTPRELSINRDINTVYNLQTHEYVDVNSFSKINIVL